MKKIILEKGQPVTYAMEIEDWDRVCDTAKREGWTFAYSKSKKIAYINGFVAGDDGEHFSVVSIDNPEVCLIRDAVIEGAKYNNKLRLLIKRGAISEKEALDFANYGSDSPFDPYCPFS